MGGFVVGFEGGGARAGFSDGVEEDCEGHGFSFYFLSLVWIWLVGWLVGG